MSSIKGKTIYIIIYNYSDYDYSIIRTMENLDEAYQYICLQESTLVDEFAMIEIENIEDITSKYVKDHLNICYIPSGNYNKYNLCNYCEMSSYAIIPMKIY
jgi:hypothetical protein